MLLQNDLLDVQVPPPQRSKLESHSMLTYFLNILLLCSFLLMLFASNNGTLWV